MASQKVPVTITYRHSGTQPPIFVAGQFSDPQWQPLQMEYTTDEDGEHTFVAHVAAKAGSKVQYKFRVGDGDWWVLNEEAPTVTDDVGNRNNIAYAPSAPERRDPHAPAQRVASTADNTVAMTTDDALGEVTDGSATHPPQPRGGSNPWGAALLPGPDASKETVNKSSTNSGASTPSFIQIVAEVADSAAILDKEEPEPYIPDEEVGKLGVLRRSSTPILEVAETAAEVAESARGLDNEENDLELQLRSSNDDNVGASGYNQSLVSDSNDSKTPLFAHECAGLYENGKSSAAYDHRDSVDHVPEDEYDLDNVDLDDPTLEKFPSNRQEIIDTVRKLEGGLDQDQSDVSGVPPSPVVGPTSHLNTDVFGDYLTVSQINDSPVVQRSVRHYDLPKSPLDSARSERSLSIASLQSISEAEEPENLVDEAKAVSGLRALRASVNETSVEVTADVGDGVLTGSLSGARTPRSADQAHKEAARPDATSNSDGHENDRSMSDVKAEPGAVESRATDNSPPASPDAVFQEPRTSVSPQIFIQTPVEPGAVTITDAERASDGTRDKTPGVDDGDRNTLGQIRQRVTAVKRPGTPSSFESAKIQPSQSTNWFVGFFKLIFVNFVGGLFGRMFSQLPGRKPKT